MVDFVIGVPNQIEVHGQGEASANCSLRTRLAQGARCNAPSNPRRIFVDREGCVAPKYSRRARFVRDVDRDRSLNPRCVSGSRGLLSTSVVAFYAAFANG